MFKLAINAGHWNGTSRGVPASLSPNNHPNEWVLNDRVVRAVIKELEGYDGIQIKRIDDPTGKVFVEDADRMYKANSWPADFYLAIHHNGGINGGSGGGIVSHTYLRDKFSGDTSKAWSRELYDALTSLIEDASLRKRLQEIAYTCAKEAFSLKRWQEAWKEVIEKVKK